MFTTASYGDSIVTGWRSITSPTQRWSSLVCTELDWHEANHAADGLGFVRWRGPDKTNTGTPLALVADLAASTADACVIALGGNDSILVKDCPDQVAAAIDRDLDVLLDRFGPHQLAVMDLYSPFADIRPPGWLAVRALLEAATRTRGLSLLPGLQDTIRGEVALLCPDEVHPNDAGHAALAAAALAPLRGAFSATAS